VGQLARAGLGVAHHDPAGLHQPGGLLRIGKILLRPLQPIGLRQEGVQILRRIEVRKGLGEGDGADLGEGRGVFGTGAADQGVTPCEQIGPCGQIGHCGQIGFRMGTT
jgi:hypothetical protein